MISTVIDVPTCHYHHVNEGFTDKFKLGRIDTNRIFSNHEFKKRLAIFVPKTQSSIRKRAALQVLHEEIDPEIDPEIELPQQSPHSTPKRSTADMQRGKTHPVQPSHSSGTTGKITVLLKRFWQKSDSLCFAIFTCYAPGYSRCCGERNSHAMTCESRTRHNTTNEWSLFRCFEI